MLCRMNDTWTFRRRFTWLATLALVIVVAACAQQTPPPEEEEPIDPLTVETEFAVTAANASETVGSVFGLLIRPFQSIGKFATEDYGAFRNGLADATLGADGSIEGRFIAPARVPRINDGFFGLAGRSFGGYYDPFMVFFPPDECPMTTTNPDDAAIATIPYMFIWDGSTLDAEGFPVVDAAVRTDRWEDTSDTDSYSETYVGIMPVMSRSAWSASSDGACTYVDEDVFVKSNGALQLGFGPLFERTYTYDVDIELEVGWQFLHVTYEYYEDATSQIESTIVRTLTVDEADDLSDVWSIVDTMSLAAATNARPNPVFERLFR